TKYNNQYYEDYGMKNKVKRYKNSITEFSQLVYGIDDLTDETQVLIVVEGIFDKCSVDKNFIIEDNLIGCVGTFKCDISESQLLKIKSKAPNISTVILLYDPDVIKQTIRNSHKLENEFEQILIGFPENDKDPGDMNAEDFDYVMQNLQNPFQFSKNHVQSGLIL